MAQQIHKALNLKKLKIDYADNEKWTHLTPDERVQIYRKCGKPCFMKASDNLDEILANPKKVLKFPICRVPKSRICSISPSGLLAANRRARLTGGLYPDVLAQTEALIKEFGTTKKARSEIEVVSVKVSEPVEIGKHMVTLVHVDKKKVELPKPLSVKVIVKRYGHLLSKPQLKKLGL